MADLHSRVGQALWLNKFSYSGNTEAVIAWAEGVLQTGWQVHVVLTGVPPKLLSLYEKHLAQIGIKYGLKYSLNINRQQIQNLLFYRSFDLLHVFHPDLFHLAAVLGRSFHLPWLAGYPAGWKEKDSLADPDRVSPAVLARLREADAVICSCSTTLQRLQPLFSPLFKNKASLHLIPPGVKTAGAPLFSPDCTHPSSQPRQQQNILYAGPLENEDLATFQALDKLVQGLENLSCGIFSWRKPPGFRGNFHPWTPASGEIFAGYTFIAGHGYLLLQALAAGKIALLFERRYAGIFSPFDRREPVPAWRAILPAEDNTRVEYGKHRGMPRKTIRWSLPQPATADQSGKKKYRQDLQVSQADQRETRSTPRHNVQLHYTGQSPGEQRKKNPQLPCIDRDTREMLRRDLLMLSTNRAVKEKLQFDGWSYARENHELAVVAEKIRRLYDRLLSR